MKSYLICFFLGINFIFLSQAKASSYNSYYCEKGFRSIQIGDAIDAVKAACGEPITTNTRKDKVDTSVNVIRWVYILSIFGNKNVVINLPSVIVTFREQKVIEVHRAGVSVNSANCAINGTVNVGDTVDQVLAVCGQPNAANTTQQTVVADKVVTEWIYNNGPYRPQIIFNFEDGKLTQIMSGQLGK